MSLDHSFNNSTTVINNKPNVNLLAQLQPQAGERILDLGCGNGNLTVQIADAGAIPTGIDLSEAMISKAQEKYPQLNIHVADARHYRTESPFDAVFSNAAVHWIKDAPAVAHTIWLALRQGGRFVAEFAGSGNVALLTNAIKQELESRGYAWEGRNPWYFPTIGQYSSLLEQTGFRVMFAQHYDNPSPLKGEHGIRKWLEMTASHFFIDVTAADQESIYCAIEEKLKPQMEQDGQWTIDTSRLRIIAVKI